MDHFFFHVHETIQKFIKSDYQTDPQAEKPKAICASNLFFQTWDLRMLHQDNISVKCIPLYSKTGVYPKYRLSVLTEAVCTHNQCFEQT